MSFVWFFLIASLGFSLYMFYRHLKEISLNIKTLETDLKALEELKKSIKALK